MSPSNLVYCENRPKARPQPWRVSRLFIMLFHHLHPPGRPGGGRPGNRKIAPIRAGAIAFGRDHPNPPNFLLSLPN